MKMRFAVLVLALVFIAPAVLCAQAARYPALAKAMARDGYAGRQGAVIGDNVFVHVPEKNDILRSQSPMNYGDVDETASAAAGWEMYQIKRDGRGVIRIDRQVDLWDEELSRASR
ncbi:MAG: hypothetical protein JXD23_10470 [Spirochaetales bacterium]|nr:hypothetical protein [Spirochaetales bacterium]